MKTSARLSLAIFVLVVVMTVVVASTPRSVRAAGPSPSRPCWPPVTTAIVIAPFRSADQPS
jgi:hypothetical protein